MLFILLTPVLIIHLWQLKTVVFFHWRLIRAVLLTHFNGKSTFDQKHLTESKIWPTFHRKWETLYNLPLGRAVYWKKSFIWWGLMSVNHYWFFPDKKKIECQTSKGLLTNCVFEAQIRIPLRFRDFSLKNQIWK